MEVVGIAKVTKESYQDPTTDDERWVVVDLEPVETLKKSVSSNDIKKDKRLKNIAIIKQGRLSVLPLTKEEFEVIVEKGNPMK